MLSSSKAAQSLFDDEKNLIKTNNELILSEEAVTQATSKKRLEKTKEEIYKTFYTNEAEENNGSVIVEDLSTDHLSRFYWRTKGIFTGMPVTLEQIDRIIASYSDSLQSHSTLILFLLDKLAEDDPYYEDELLSDKESNRLVKYISKTIYNGASDDEAMKMAASYIIKNFIL